MSFNDINDILDTVADDFAAVDNFITHHLDSRVPLIMQVSQYLVAGGGKRLRPLVCLLAARATGYQEGNAHILAAAIIEMLHTATLIHDDVVDESDLRRGRATVNSAWNNATAVLVGDFLISRAFQLIVSLKSQAISEIMSDSTCIVAEGEVLQLINQRDPNTTEQRYMDVIYSKTAQLFVAATETGAELGNPLYRPAMKKYAVHFGAAFQIIDDIMDYTSSAEEMGKNVGDDLAEGKPTLPLIQAIKTAPTAQAQLIKDAIKTGGLEHLDEILIIVRESGALDYCMQRAQEESQLAIDALDDLPSSKYKDALIALAKLALKRTA